MCIRDRTYSSYSLFPLPYASHYNNEGVAVGDINNDGRKDIVVANYNRGLDLLYNTTTPVSYTHLDVYKRQRFYRVESSRNRNDGGSGLGLAIVKHIMEAHKENISVESVYLEGTKFSFMLEKAL